MGGTAKDSPTVEFMVSNILEHYDASDDTVRAQMGVSPAVMQATVWIHIRGRAD
jgi:hypothetical protein